MLKFSLLYKTPEEPDYRAAEDMGGALYDLSLDQAVRSVCESRRSADYFLEVLKSPLRRVENVRYRQEIIRDILQHPQLLVDLKRLFKRYDTIQADWKEMRANVYGFGVSVSQQALLEYTFSLLQVTAKFSKMIIGYFFSIDEVLSAYALSSEGLSGMRGYCRDMIENDALQEIVDIASHFLHYSPEHYEFGIAVHVDDGFRLRACHLCDAVDQNARTKTRPFWQFLSKKSGAEDIPAASPREDCPEDAEFALNEAIFRMYTVLTDITNQVYELFYGLSRELLFYDAAADCCAFLQSRGMPACMPQVLEMERDLFDARGLYDLLLLQEGLTPEQIVTNDVRFGAQCDGILIRGNNSSGKTVYLRSIGIAQVFAQAGLPVCAQSAKISVRDAIFTQFSSAEKDFKIGDTAGRFEGEVQSMARIIDRLRPYSLLLLNEIFQTTSYPEGTAGIFDILCVLPPAKAKFVFVTHLTHLYELCNPARVRLMESEYGERRYKISELPAEKKPD